MDMDSSNLDSLGLNLDLDLAQKHQDSRWRRKRRRYVATSSVVYAIAGIPVITYI